MKNLARISGAVSLILIGAFLVPERPVQPQLMIFPEPRWDIVLKKYEPVDEEPELKSLEQINEYVNSFPYKTDAVNYERTDYWASPKEFYDHGSGDCEDYVIAKYFLAKKIGKHGQFVIVMSKQTKQYHAILVVDGLVLDNNFKHIQRFDSKKIQDKYLIIGALNNAEDTDKDSREALERASHSIRWNTPKLQGDKGSSTTICKSSTGLYGDVRLCSKVWSNSGGHER